MLCGKISLPLNKTPKRQAKAYRTLPPQVGCHPIRVGVGFYDVADFFGVATAHAHHRGQAAPVQGTEYQLIAAAAAPAAGAGSSSPSSSSFSTVTHHPAALVGQFGVEAEEAADLAYMSEYAYNSYMNMMDLAPGYFGGVYDHFN